MIWESQLSFKDGNNNFAEALSCLCEMLFLGKSIVSVVSELSQSLTELKVTGDKVCLSPHYGCETYLPPAHSVLTATLFELRCHTKLSHFATERCL